MPAPSQSQALYGPLFASGLFPQNPTLQFLASEIELSLLFSPSPPILSRQHVITTPSFTLVLTSGHPSSLSPTIQPSSAMLPTAPDFLMKTIDLRHHSMDVRFDEGRDEDVEVEQMKTKPIKRNFSFLVHKLVSYKQKFVTSTCKTDRLSSPN